MSCWMKASELPQSTPAIFNARMRDELKLDSLPVDFRRKYEDAIAAGHCNLLRAEELPRLGRARKSRVTSSWRG